MNTKRFCRNKDIFFNKSNQKKSGALYNLAELRTRSRCRERHNSRSDGRSSIPGLVNCTALCMAAAGRTEGPWGWDGRTGRWAGTLRGFPWRSTFLLQVKPLTSDSCPKNFHIFRRSPMVFFGVFDAGALEQSEQIDLLSVKRTSRSGLTADSKVGCGGRRSVSPPQWWSSLCLGGLWGCFYCKEEGAKGLSSIFGGKHAGRKTLLAFVSIGKKRYCSRFTFLSGVLRP